jgi:hypothetical protein
MAQTVSNTIESVFRRVSGSDMRAPPRDPADDTGASTDAASRNGRAKPSAGILISGDSDAA